MHEGSEVARCERWENSEVTKSERWGGSEVASWKGEKGGRVVRWQDGRFLVLFEDGGRRVSPRFYNFVSDVNQWNEWARWVQDILACLQGWILFRFSASFGECSRVWKCLEFIIADKFRVKIVWLCNFILDEMKNLTFGHQWILLVVTSLVWRRVETKEISY